MYALNDVKSLDALVSDMDTRKIVMLGEASHGTHEYYHWRTAISKRLIEEKKHRFIAVEGDWPDCYKINRFIKGYPDAGDNIYTVLDHFDRWPSWMWANEEVAELAEWLRDYNRRLPTNEKIGFYGLDVYSLWDSINEITEHLGKTDAEAAQYVKKAATCFEPFNENEQLYARHSLHAGCRDELIALLKKIQADARITYGDPEAVFNTEQNALVALNAEHYYSNMVGFDNQSWNIRDRHMMETLKRLMEFHGPAAKGIVWAHNSHIGDARATNMSRAGMVNIGQLAREEYGAQQVQLTGFGSYRGTVIAAKEWSAPMEIMEAPDAQENSIEAHLHKTIGKDCYFLSGEDNGKAFQNKIGHRAIGVVYDPAWERFSNYVPSVLSKRYDAFIFLDDTHALHPLHPQVTADKIPETFPSGE